MTLDPTAKKKDGVLTPPGQATLPAGSEQTSAVEQLTSKIEAEKQYSGVEALKLVQDALSADGREQKDRADKAEAQVKLLTTETTDLTTKFNTVSGQVTQLLKAHDDAEAEAVKDDVVALGSLRARQANTAEGLRLEGIKNEYEAKNTKLTERETEVTTKLTSVNIKLAATAGGVDEKTLGDLVPDGDPERLKKMANILKQSGQQALEIDPATGKPKLDSAGKPIALTQTPASTISAGADARSVSEVMLQKAKEKK